MTDGVRRRGEMSIRRAFVRFCSTSVVVARLVDPQALAAQAQPTGGAVTHQDPASADQHVHHEAGADEHAAHDMAWMAREGSGTGWIPEASPMYAIHGRAAGWQLMTHANVFAQFLRESGERGADQFGSVNWFMGMAHRSLGPGRLGLRGMISVEPWTVGGCGYPDLLASGERCKGEAIHDRQHPHDLVMELAASYDAPLAGGLWWQVYGGPAAEPALGPVAFPHRPSALPNLIAPIAHHWLDATHVTFGSMTAGVYGRLWKAEASAFNGREPDERRSDLDLGRLDSVSGRLWLTPSPSLAIQISAGKLVDAEPGESGAGAAPVDVTRATASLMYQRTLAPDRDWATTVAWGRNRETGEASSAWLLESSLTVRDRETYFGRFEVAGKSAHDLAVEDAPGSFSVAKLQGGYTKYFGPPLLRSWAPGVGAAVSASFVPARLRSAYGGRVSIGAAAYLTLRPARVGGGSGSGSTEGVVPPR